MTLFELLVVMALIAVFASLAMPAIGRIFPKYRLSSVSDTVVAELRRLKAVSIGTGKTARFVVNTKSRAYGGADRPARILPDDVNVELIVAKQYLSEPDTAEIRFFPDGTSSGGRVIFSSDALRQEITIDWFSGRVEKSL